MSRPLTKAQLDVPVTESLTLLMTALTLQFDVMAVQIDVATNALDQFVIKGKVHPNAPLQTLFSTTDSFTAPTALIDCSGDLTTQAVGTGGFRMDVRGYYQVAVYAASSNAAGSLVDIYAGFK